MRPIALIRTDDAPAAKLAQLEAALEQAHRQIESRVQERTAVRQLLELPALKTTRKEYLGAVVKVLRDWCACRCAGVRLLTPDGRLPYAAQVGFSRRFLAQEDQVCLGTQGCACVRIFQHRIERVDLHWIGGQGSFFCNQASRLAIGATTPVSLPCLAAGYESLAHTPIRYHGRLIGSIHLADPEAGRFPPPTMAFIEYIAPLLGEAIHRFDIETSLQESEQRFRAMFERHKTVMLLADPASGAIVDANPAAASFYGYTRRQLRALTIHDLRTQPAPEVQGRPAKAHASYTAAHRRAQGETRLVEVHASPIQVLGRLLLFLIIHDITERKQLEKQLLDISEQERQRVGQDLHDSLGGKLAGAALLGKALAQTLAASGLPQAGMAQEIVQCLNEAIAQTRAIARGLCPVQVSHAGLASGLAEFASEVERRFKVACRFEADPGIGIQDASMASHLFHIVQEAVHNAIRHGAARRITIRLADRNEGVALEIRDDGVGLPRPLPAGNGLGLRTMRYRADIMGAQLTLQSPPGGGTVVACRLPPGVTPVKED